MPTDTIPGTHSNGIHEPLAYCESRLFSSLLLGGEGIGNLDNLLFICITSTLSASSPLLCLSLALLVCQRIPAHFQGRIVHRMESTWFRNSLDWFQKIPLVPWVVRGDWTACSKKRGGLGGKWFWLGAPPPQNMGSLHAAVLAHPTPST